MGKDKTFEQLGGSAFWILIILISLMGLSFLGIWAFHANSIKGVAISAIFFGMIVSGILLSKFEIFNSGTWSQNCLSFTLGYLIYLPIGALQSSKSVLSITQNALFATIASELPQFLEFVVNTFIIPIAEEVFWMVGIPFSIMSIMNIAGMKYPIFKNFWVQFIVITVVSGVTFAAFHVGKLLFGFLIAAFVFRGIMIFAAIGDQKKDLIPFVTLVPAFAVGAHVGNNWGDYGFSKGLSLIFQNLDLGWFIIMLLVIIFLSAINQIIIAILKILKKLGVKVPI